MLQPIEHTYMAALPATRPRRKYAAPLLSPRCLHELSVPGEFAARLGGGGAGEERGEAALLVVCPLGKVWRVELSRRPTGGGDSGVAWLGSGWAELAAARGLGVGWTVVLTLERRGVATLRAFDPGCCLARYSTPHAGFTGKNRPRFIKLLHPQDLEELRIPDKFVQLHLTESFTINHQNAMICCPPGKFWRVELCRDHPDALLRDGWAKFVEAHHLSQGNILLFRYEGNMVFTAEVFLQNGCLKEYKTSALDKHQIDYSNGPSNAPQQSATKLEVSPVKRKRKPRNKKSRVLTISVMKVEPRKELLSIEPRHSFAKHITGYALKTLFAVKGNFCSQVGLAEACTVTLKTSMKNTRSWEVAFNIANNFGYIMGPGWRKFCQENKIKEGDHCTFNAIETMVWHVVIVHN